MVNLTPTRPERTLRPGPHQFVARREGAVLTEELFGDRVVQFLYCRAREHAPTLFRAATSRWFTRLLGLAQFDLPLASRLLGSRRFLESCGVDLAECLDDPRTLTTPRRIFERKIRYEEFRPQPETPRAAVSPADARVVVGSLREGSPLFLKDKFFAADELLGVDRPRWQSTFGAGDWAIFRLTPDKYHYNHTPVSGLVVDHYELQGAYHSCNPGAVVAEVTPYSKNRRVVTVFDTDMAGGSGLGLVAMVEVVALMIGDVVQCYSRRAYDEPVGMATGLVVERGRPKSLYRPGSSTSVLLFEPGRVRFAADLVENLEHRTAQSRFSQGFGRPLVETELAVRSLVATAARRDEHEERGEGVDR